MHKRLTSMQRVEEHLAGSKPNATPSGSSLWRSCQTRPQRTVPPLTPPTACTSQDFPSDSLPRFIQRAPNNAHS
jgi:hypothetical protein